MAGLPRPVGHHTVTPGFAVSGVARVITFLERAFGGRVTEKYELPGGVIGHAEVLLGDSIVMMGEAGSGHEARPGSFSLYVDDGPTVDATYARALAEGAVVLRPPADQFYGYRSATVQDPGGNQWTICAVVERLTPDEIARRMASFS